MSNLEPDDITPQWRPISGRFSWRIALLAFVVMLGLNSALIYTFRDRPIFSRDPAEEAAKNAIDAIQDLKPPLLGIGTRLDTVNERLNAVTRSVDSLHRSVAGATAGHTRR
jgi:hypothetical protein